MLKSRKDRKKATKLTFRDFLPKNPEKSENLSFSLEPNEVSLSFIISFQIDAFVLCTIEIAEQKQ